MARARTLGELKKSNYRSVSVKDEMRANLLRKLASDEPVFPGIVGFDDTVIPQIANAILSRHNFILLGLRGQAKSRILRSLVTLLDEQIPFVAGCEINDDPLKAICRACHQRLEECGDRKSTRLNSSHRTTSYAVFCLKKKKPTTRTTTRARPKQASTNLTDILDRA